MIDILELVNRCRTSLGFFFKFVSANDTGQTGSHQAGLYMPRSTWQLFFSSPGEKEMNKDVNVTIEWDFGETTLSRYIWYGRGTRSEYRLTRGINFLGDENIGDLIVLIKQSNDNFYGYLLESDTEIEEFLNAMNLSPVDSCQVQIQKHDSLPDSHHNSLYRDWLEKQLVDFPTSYEISAAARRFATNLKPHISSNYDMAIINWTEIEYALFRFIENDRYKKYLSVLFSSIPELIDVANTILNRRKSRAGHSLENHLGYIFASEKIPYSTQERTEGNKKPDFIFPGIIEYKDINFPTENLIILAAKTTCKDRWRQILNEASRVNCRYLITLQHGISENQLKEMESEHVKLIVPVSIHSYYPASYQSGLIGINTFIQFLKTKYVN